MVGSAFLNTLTMGTSFPRVPLEMTLVTTNAGSFPQLVVRDMCSTMRDVGSIQSVVGVSRWVRHKSSAEVPLHSVSRPSGPSASSLLGASAIVLRCRPPQHQRPMPVLRTCRLVHWPGVFANSISFYCSGFRKHQSEVPLVTGRSLKNTVLTGIIGGAEIARPDIARPDNAAPDQIVVLEHGWIEHAERQGLSALNPVCHDSTAALTVTCSFCVQSAILSALIQSPYSHGTTTAAATAAARTKTRTGRRPCQQRQLQGRWNRQKERR